MKDGGESSKFALVIQNTVLGLPFLQCLKLLVLSTTTWIASQKHEICCWLLRTAMVVGFNCKCVCGLSKFGTKHLQWKYKTSYIPVQFLIRLEQSGCHTSESQCCGGLFSEFCMTQLTSVFHQGMKLPRWLKEAIMNVRLHFWYYYYYYYRDCHNLKKIKIINFNKHFSMKMKNI